MGTLFCALFLAWTMCASVPICVPGPHDVSTVQVDAELSGISVLRPVATVSSLTLTDYDYIIFAQIRLILDICFETVLHVFKEHGISCKARLTEWPNPVGTSTVSGFFIHFVYGVPYELWTPLGKINLVVHNGAGGLCFLDFDELRCVQYATSCDIIERLQQRFRFDTQMPIAPMRLEGPCALTCIDSIRLIEAVEELLDLDRRTIARNIYVYNILMDRLKDDFDLVTRTLGLPCEAYMDMEEPD